ncbi:MAG: AAA family ATPase [Devosia sp.]
MSRFVIISGCSGGGKSTLLDELARRGHATVPEPGRRVVREEQANGGSALPWADTRAFVDRIMAMAKADYAAASGNPGWTFFDRGLFDAVSALGQLEGTGLRAALLAGHDHHRQVFLAPPWREIHVSDGERQHGMVEAEIEYRRLLGEYPAQGYETVLLPKTGVSARADFVEGTLGLGPAVH